MFIFLEKLQNRPKSFRQKLAWGASGALSLLIAAIWVTATFYGGLGGAAAKVADSSQSPFESLRASAIGGLENLQQQFNDLKSKIGSFSETVYEATTEATSTASSTEF